jgi:L-cysteine S-thiosulfotransferase
MNRSTLAAVAGAVLVAMAAMGAHAQGKDTAAEIEKYRQALADGNPAELWEARGEAMWTEAHGPKKASFEKCDLGMGPGVVKGAYAHLPRYFADTASVMDLETRLIHCMTTLQGISEADAHKTLFGGPGQRSNIEALAAYVTAQSRGTVMDVSLADPQMKKMYAMGEKIFFYRGGSHDFACATCHGEDSKRIRLQDLPDLTKKAGAQKAYATWPAYRVSQGELRTMQWRLNDCFRQQRFPDLVFGSPASIALTTYLAYNANGAVYDGPALKR